MKPFIQILLLAVVVSSAVTAQEQNQADADQAAADAYQEGQTALREQNFTGAIEAFERAQSAGQRIDAAAYWHAYALLRAGRERQASAAVRNLLRRYPQSEWADDARALEAEMNTAQVSPDAEEELRLYALYHLMEANPERGMALLRDMLKKTESVQTKRHLLFLMAAQHEDGVSSEIVELAKDSSDPELQIQAIHIIAASGNEDAVEVLGKLYRGGLDLSVRRAIIDAHIAAESPRALGAIVRKETDPALKRQGIMALGAMEAVEELRALYPVTNDPALRRALLEAFAMSGQIGELAGVIESERDPSLRAVAIRGLGIAGDERSAEILTRLAASATDPAEQRAILEAVMMLDNGTEVAVAIARETSDPAILRMAIQTLGMLGESALLLDLYGQLKIDSAEVQHAVLNALAMTGDGVEFALRIAKDSRDSSVAAHAVQTLAILGATEELRELYDSLESEALRRVALQHLAHTGDSQMMLELLASETRSSVRADIIRALVAHDSVDPAAVAALYPSAGNPEKHAIIDLLMVHHADRALVGLLETETELALRRRLLQALMATGTELAEEYLFQWLEQKQ